LTKQETKDVSDDEEESSGDEEDQTRSWWNMYSLQPIFIYTKRPVLYSSNFQLDLQACSQDILRRIR
jgi:hypothetical protein